MTETKNWYAVYTRPRWEKKVAESFSKNKIENYCPLNRVTRQWSDRKKIIYEPLFTSYVFVNVSEKEHLILKKTTGVINLVHWLNKPAVIPEHEINAIREFLNEYACVGLQKRPIAPADHVRIIDGPLMSLEGQVLYVKSKSLKIALPSLGYMMYAEVETDNVELLPNIPTHNNETIYPPLSAAK
jgi:transcription antitermination factor NusG